MAPKKVTPRGSGTKGPTAPKPRRKAATKKAAPKSKTGLKYIRNTRGVLVRVTLDSGRRIQLEPRGQRNDAAPVNLEEQEDSIFLANLGLLYEVISVEEAKEIIAKQNTNALNPQGPHPSEIIVNEKGEPVKVSGVTDTYESQGKVVGTIEKTPGGRFVETGETITRVVGPERAKIPGTVDNPLPDDAASDPFGGLKPGGVDPTQQT